MSVAILGIAVFAKIALAGLLLTGRHEWLRPGGVREVLLVAAMLNGLFLAAVTELLSAMDLLTPPALVLGWSAGLVCQIPLWRKVFRTVWEAPRPRLDRMDVVLLGAAAIVFVGTALAALFAPPNNFDSMTYHMGRVANWRQHQSVDFYATHIERQLSSAPLAEYAILHLHLLTGGDRLANMVQWLASVWSALAVSLIACEWGAGRRGQLIALVFGVTFPMTVLQASSTQNDLVLSLWVLCFCYFMLRFVAHPTWAGAGAAGAALGLALVTKATAFFWIAGLTLPLLLSGWRTLRAPMLLRLSAMCAVGVALCLPLFHRNQSTFRHPLSGAGDRIGAANPDHGVRSTVGNVIRRVAAQVDMPPNRLRITAHVHELADRVDSAAGRFRPGAITDAPAVSAFVPGDWRQAIQDEDVAGGPLHFLLMIPAAFASLLRAARSGGMVQARYVLVGVVVSLILLSAMLKWSPYSTRFDMTGVLLLAPLLGLYGDRLKGEGLLVGLIALIMVQCSYPLLRNNWRPLLGPESIFRVSRDHQYLVASGSHRHAIIGAVSFLNGRKDREIGLLIQGNSYEYPLWALVKGVDSGATRVCHVDVMNESHRFEDHSCVPSAVYTDYHTDSTITVRDVVYAEAWRHGPFAVYVAP